MSAPTIPGLSQYPELEKKFRRRYAEASRDKRCASCVRSKLLQATKNEIAQRQRRDK